MGTMPEIEKVRATLEQVEWELVKNKLDNLRWKQKNLWFNNPAYPREFKRRIKALEKVRELFAEKVAMLEVVEASRIGEHREEDEGRRQRLKAADGRACKSSPTLPGSKKRGG